jgi:hypothetical protein
MLGVWGCGVTIPKQRSLPHPASALVVTTLTLTHAVWTSW